MVYPKTPEYYRNWAEQMRMVAAATRNEVVRARFLDIADDYDYIANVTVKMKWHEQAAA